MAAGIIYNKFQEISANSELFTATALSQFSLIEGRSYTTEEIVVQQRNLFLIFQSNMQQIASLKTDLAQEIENPDALDFITRVTAIEESNQNVFITFNNKVLTKYPCAAIQHSGNPALGSALVGQRTQSPPSLQEIAPVMRPVLGDGNCFYTSYTVRRIESLLKQNAIPDFIANMYSSDIEGDDIFSAITQTLLNLQENPLLLETVLQDPHQIFPFIAYFKRITAKELETHPDQYAASLRNEVAYELTRPVEGETFHSLIQKYVLEMGVDATHSAMQALCEKENISVRIVTSPTDRGIDMIVGQEPQALFWRSGEDEGHYSILYPIEPIPQTPHVNGTIVKTPPPPISSTPSSGSLALGTGFSYYAFYTADSSSPPGSELPAELMRALSPEHNDAARPAPSTIRVHYTPVDGEQLYVRGNKGGLSWERGIAMSRTGPDQWELQTQEYKGTLDFRIFRNDSECSLGENLKIKKGAEMEVHPSFTAAELPASQPVATYLVVRYDGPETDVLTLRGEGPEMNGWKKKFTFERSGNTFFLRIPHTQTSDTIIRYKFLLNDKWLKGENKKVKLGTLSPLTIQKTDFEK